MKLQNTFVKKLVHLFFLFKRPMTLGVRALVQNEKGEILLVRHTYVEGWFFPGGGVERGEDCFAACKKELLEEANVILLSDPKIISFHFNTSTSPRDHVAFYRCEDWQQDAIPAPNHEIAELGFFALDQLPEGTTKSTKARLDEVFNGAPLSPYW